MKKFHVIAGLPRSGSTLLTVLLNQNPRFQSDITDPLLDVIRSTMMCTHSDPVVAKQVTPEKRREILRCIVSGWYKDSTEVVFNTNRIWTSWTQVLAELYPDAKIICCVRRVSSILNSFEHQALNNPLQMSSAYDKGRAWDVYGRCAGLMSEHGNVGAALRSLKAGLASTQNKNIYLVAYTDLVEDPEGTLRGIYEFIGEDYNEADHTFGSVDFERSEYDASLNSPGLHDVSGAIALRKRPNVLPQEIIDHYNKQDLSI